MSTFVDDSEIKVLAVGSSTAAAPESVKQITFVSSDGQAFQIPITAANLSETAKSMIVEDENENEIPLPNVKSTILAKVIEFCQHYILYPMGEIEKPPKTSVMTELVDEWYAKYVEVDQETLFELILAANYMDIKPLLDLTCTVIATMLRGKTPEEIHKTFNIPLDFTAEGEGGEEEVEIEEKQNENSDEDESNSDEHSENSDN